MKRVIFTFLVCLICILCNAQTTYFNGSWSPGTSECGRLTCVEIRDDGVIITIEMKALKALKRMRVFSTYNTFITIPAENDLRILRLSGLMVGNEIKTCGINDSWGWDNVSMGEIRSYQLFFKGKLPPGITSISIIDYGDSDGRHGFCFFNRTINNPRKNYLDYTSEYDVKQHIDQNNDGICGIYEPVDESGANLACVKHEGEYCLIYLSAPSKYPGKSFWKIGDIKAKLRNTASGLMKAEWYMADKSLNTLYVVFDGVSMIATDTKGTEESVYLKTYPTNSPNVGNSGGKEQNAEWTGTGFALKNGYIVTNHHVVDGASSIVVQGVNGTSIEYKAEVVSVDKNNDLALIRIDDYRFDGFGAIPYSVKESMCEVGEDVFVLGYPLTSYMGEEIKLTNGIISSKSGYQGDITTYQISAPVQPGNSGGPMFDKNGNIVGIVNAGIPGAENVGYAIKASYMCNLVNSSVSNAILPNNNTVSSKSLPDKVKTLRNYVFYIKCK